LLGLIKYDTEGIEDVRTLSQAQTRSGKAKTNFFLIFKNQLTGTDALPLISVDGYGV